MAKSKFTTTLDTELLKQAKIEAIQLDMSVAEFLEKLIIFIDIYVCTYYNKIRKGGICL